MELHQPMICEHSQVIQCDAVVDDSGDFNEDILISYWLHYNDQSQPLSDKFKDYYSNSMKHYFDMFMKFDNSQLACIFIPDQYEMGISIIKSQNEMEVTSVKIDQIIRNAMHTARQTIGADGHRVGFIYIQYCTHEIVKTEIPKSEN